MLLSEGGIVSIVTGSAVRRSLIWRSVVISGATRTRSASSLSAGGAFAKAVSRLGQAAHLHGGGAVEAARRARKVAGRLVDRFQCFSRGRFGVDLVGVECVLQEKLASSMMASFSS